MEVAVETGCASKISLFYVACGAWLCSVFLSECVYKIRACTFLICVLGVVLDKRRCLICSLCVQRTWLREGDWEWLNCLINQWSSTSALGSVCFKFWSNCKRRCLICSLCVQRTWLRGGDWEWLNCLINQWSSTSAPRRRWVCLSERRLYGWNLWCQTEWEKHKLC